MALHLAKVIKEKYKEDHEAVEKISGYVKEFLSSATHPTGDHEAYAEWVKVVVFDREDGNLAVVGSIDFESTAYYQAEKFDEEIEVLPPPAARPGTVGAVPDTMAPRPSD